VMALLVFLISSAVVLLLLSAAMEFGTRVLERNVMMAIRLMEMVALPAASVRVVYPRVTELAYQHLEEISALLSALLLAHQSAAALLVDTQRRMVVTMGKTINYTLWRCLLTFLSATTATQ
jgi:hypothetical protein